MSKTFVYVVRLVRQQWVGNTDLWCITNTKIRDTNKYLDCNHIVNNKWFQLLSLQETNWYLLIDVNFCWWWTRFIIHGQEWTGPKGERALPAGPMRFRAEIMGRYGRLSGPSCIISMADFTTQSTPVTWV